MKLENEFLYAEISEMGAEVIRIYDKENQRDILWEGDPKYWKRHSPVLFPNVGKTYRNTVRIGGIQYPTSQHGFARDTMFICIKSSKDNASFMILSNEEMKEVYPYDFELHISYQLRGAGSRVASQEPDGRDDVFYDRRASGISVCRSRRKKRRLFSEISGQNGIELYSRGSGKRNRCAGSELSVGIRAGNVSGI